MKNIQLLTKKKCNNIDVKQKDSRLKTSKQKKNILGQKKHN